jgi:hypothetical protein
MTNPFDQLSAESAEARLAQVESHEGGEDSHLEAAYEARTEIEDAPYDGGGWPGDGGGSDDFADYNLREADDYRDEG